MPKQQEGSVIKMAGSWGARFRDAAGSSRRQSGFKTERQARKWLDNKLDEVQAERRGELVAKPVEPITVDELCDQYLEIHGNVVSAGTIRALRDRLGYFRKTFGDQRVDRLSVSELRSWRGTLPELSAWGIVKAVRQLLGYAVECGYVVENIAKKIPNPEPKRREVAIFETFAEVEAVDAEMPKHLRGIVVFGVLTGLRPEELIGLERRDVDRERRLLHVRRVFVNGVLRDGGKTPGSVRTVPLTSQALAALDARPARLDSRLLFPGERGGHLNLNTWRRRCWAPAIIAAGISRRLTPYSARHTWISWALSGGVPVLEVARLAGTSAAQIDATYGHLTRGSHDRVRDAIEAFTASQAQAEESSR